jgi:hypothetical protein
MRNSKWQYLLASVVSSILAMGCKEQSVIIVPCLLLFDWMLFKRNMRSLKVYIEKVYYLIPAIAIFIVTLVANKDTGEEIIGYTIVDRFIFLCYSVFKYLLISAIPFKLSYLYPFPFPLSGRRKDTHGFMDIPICYPIHRICDIPEPQKAIIGLLHAVFHITSVAGASCDSATPLRCCS